MEEGSQHVTLWKDIAIGAVAWFLALPVLPTFIIFGPLIRGPIRLIEVLTGWELWWRESFFGGPTSLGVALSFVIIVAVVVFVRRYLASHPKLGRMGFLVWLTLYVAALLLGQL